MNKESPKTALYELLLEEGQRRMLKSFVENENLPAVMQSKILEELEQTREKILDKFGRDKGQYVALVLAMNQFAVEELIKISILLAGFELTPGDKLLSSLEMSPENFKLDCAEGFAQKLQSYSNESAAKTISKLLNVRSEWATEALKNFKTESTQAKEG